jgi:kanamycin kinase
VTILVGPIPVPEVVAGIAAGRDVVPVRVNELGGVTFRVADEFVKTATPRWGGHLVDETDRSRWALAGAPVAAARAIGAGLRELHDRLPVDGCPFEWSVPGRLAESPRLRRSGLEQPPTVDL